MKPDFEAEARSAYEGLRARYDAVVARLDAVRFDPPTWSLRQALVLLAVVGVLTLGVYITGRQHGGGAVSGGFEAARSGLQAKVDAEDEQLRVRLEAELSSLRAALGEAENKRATAEEALAAALETQSQGSRVGAAGATSASSINKIIREVSR